MMDIENLFELAELGGQLKACHDIFSVLQADGMSDEERVQKLQDYHSETADNFKKKRLAYEMDKANSAGNKPLQNPR